MLLKSVQLGLLIGPIIPLTPPQPVMEALASVEVQVDDVGQSGFKLTFSIDKQSPLNILFLLTGGMPLLFMRVVISATPRPLRSMTTLEPSVVPWTACCKSGQPKPDLRMISSRPARQASDGSG